MYLIAVLAHHLQLDVLGLVCHLPGVVSTEVDLRLFLMARASYYL